MTERPNDIPHDVWGTADSASMEWAGSEVSLMEMIARAILADRQRRAVPTGYLENLADHLEPGCITDEGHLGVSSASTSQAISLKRIADALEKIASTVTPS